MLCCTSDVFQRGAKTRWPSIGRQKQRAAGKRHSLTNAQYPSCLWALQISSLSRPSPEAQTVFYPFSEKWVKRKQGEKKKMIRGTSLTGSRAALEDFATGIAAGHWTIWMKYISCLQNCVFSSHIHNVKSNHQRLKILTEHFSWCYKCIRIFALIMYDEGQN